MTRETDNGGHAVRVVVVGVGAITAMGPTATDLWLGARSGRVAIGPVQRIDMSGFQTKVAGEVDAAPESRAYPRPEGYRERALELALVAAEEALAVLPAGTFPAERIGAVLGTCNAGLLAAREWLQVERTGVAADPRLAALVTPQGLAEALAAAFGLRGAVLAVNTACASGANAIGMAADLVRHGKVDAVLAGGTDALSDVVLAGFTALQSLAPEPAAPYCLNRQGLSLGEGSGMLLLVRDDLAALHGLPVLGEVAGYALSADGYHATAPRPDGTGAAQAIRSALRHAGVQPAEVGYVNGHGTGTPKNDVAESKAIGLALGDANDALLVSSTKSVVGHLLGAAGAVEAIVTLHALADQVAPPTANYAAADPDCPLRYVPNTAVPMSTDVAVSNNFAFAGANASLVLTRHCPRPAPPQVAHERVVVTGVACLTPAGDDVDAAWEAYVRRRICHELVDGLRLGRVDIDPDPYLSRRDRRRMDRLGVLSTIATARALSSSGLSPGTAATESVGVVFGTGAGPMEAMERFVLPLLAEGPEAADPGVFPNTVYNQAAGQVAMHLGLRGPTSTLSVGHASGAATLAYARDLVALGHADTIVATVTDTLTPAVVRAYAAGPGVSRRADAAGGDGRFALAEGSVSIVLERRSSALARGATPLGELAGSGMAFDALPSLRCDVRGRGLERAMREAIDAASVTPSAVTDVWLAAAGYSRVDRAEGAAVKRVFDGCGSLDAPRLHAPKVPLGEPIGVGGALGAALALHSWRTHAAGPALVNSSSLGGTHVSLLLQP